MSMSHKAYAFDWRTFKDDELHRILLESLKTGDTAAIANYIEAHREEIKDPYGGPIEQGWQATLGDLDVHEYGDLALTRFYDPADDRGIGDSWLAVDAMLEEQDRTALLGCPLGEARREFDPGRQGSYFQTPGQVVESLRRVERVGHTDVLQSYTQLLRACAVSGLGVYVTF